MLDPDVLIVFVVSWGWQEGGLGTVKLPSLTFLPAPQCTSSDKGESPLASGLRGS